MIAEAAEAAAAAAAETRTKALLAAGDPPNGDAPGAPTLAPVTPPPASEQMRSLPSSPPTNETHRLAADGFEILCNDVLLPNNMTLAAVRHYVWRQAGELVMQYRRKTPPPLSLE